MSCTTATGTATACRIGYCWEVAKVTERFVYAYDRRDWRDDDKRRTIRLDRATLERDGKCYHRAALSSLHVRPEIDWPMVVIDVRDGRRQLTA